MAFRRFLNLAVAVMVTAGLIVGPLATPATAAQPLRPG
jgi:hypothetical protein